MGTRLIKQYGGSEWGKGLFVPLENVGNVGISHISHIFSIKATRCPAFLLYVADSDDCPLQLASYLILT